MGEDQGEKFTEKNCEKNMEIVMLKFDNKLMASIGKITKIFETSLTLAKKDFAKKKDFDDLKTTVETIQSIHEKRQYDWLKYAVVTALTIIIAKLI